MTRLTCSKPGCDQPRQIKGGLHGPMLKFCQRHNDENRERNRRFREARSGRGNIMEATMSKLLSTSEAAQLTALESVIEQGIGTFVAVGEALETIRDSRLYRTDHATFEDYCQARWKMTRRYANNLIRAADVVGELGTNVPKDGDPASKTPLPKTEAVAREVAKAPPEKRAETWRKAVDTAPKDEAGEPVVTARHVSKLVAEFAKEGADPVGETAKPDGPAWAAFESEVEELVGELTAIERKMMRVLDSHAAENKCRAPWAYFIPYSGTVGLVRQARKSLLDNLPAETASKHPGYISRKAVEQRDAVERQGRKSA